MSSLYPQSPTTRGIGGLDGESESGENMAEREGFEPPIPVKVWPLSRRLVSTTHAPLRIKRQRIAGPSTRLRLQPPLRISAVGSNARKAPQLSRRLVSTTHAPLRIKRQRIAGPSTRLRLQPPLRISAVGSNARKAPQLSRRLVSTTHAPLRAEKHGEVHDSRPFTAIAVDGSGLVHHTR